MKWTGKVITGAGVVLFAIGCGSSSNGGGQDHSGHTGGLDAGQPGGGGSLAVSYDAIYVVNGGANSLSVLRASTGEVAETLPLENVAFPHHVNLSQDSSKLVLAVPGVDLSAGHGGGHASHGVKGLLLVLDAKTGATLKSRQLDAMNHNGIFSPDGTEIWTSQMTSPGSVLVLDASTLETLNTIAVGNAPAEVTFSKDGKRAFVANGESDSVTVIDSASKAVERTIIVGDGPVGAWAGANNVMYVDNEAGKSLTAIDAVSLNVLRTYNLGFTPAMVATGPNDELWVTDTDNGKVVITMTTMDHKMGEVATAAGAHGIAFSDDAATAYITNQTAGTVSVVDVATKTVRATVPVGAKPNGLVFRKN